MIEKLFIIGNGFDLAHGIKSSYKDFKTFLEDKQNGHSNEDFYKYPGLIKNEQDLCNFLIQVIDNAEGEGLYWKNIEDSLSKLEFKQSFGMVDNFQPLGKEMPAAWLKNYVEESISEWLLNSTTYIKNYFSEWINTIATSVSHKQDIKKLFIDNPAFLSFNYTDTLQQIYNISDACHIHGKINEKIYFGHGNHSEMLATAHLEHSGAFNKLFDLGEELRKKTEDALRDNNDFFNRISNSTKEIYSFGFSYGDVDLVYIQAICKKLPRDAVWYLNEFDKKNNIKFEEKIRKCGYNGTFSRYSTLD